MEFLEYKAFVDELRTGHVVPSGDADLTRFSIETPDDTDNPRVQIHRLLFAPAALCGDVGEGVRVIETPAEQVPERLDALIHAARLPEVAIIPAGLWRTVMDLVAYELATDESWLDVDAEAALHVNTRDPLLLLPPDLHLLRTLASALLTAVQNTGGGEAAQDLSIVAPGSAMVFELDHRGAIRVQCANGNVADHLASVG